MQPRQCVGSELGDDDRLVVAAGPQPKLVFKPALGGDEVAGVDVPTEVTIQENDVEQVRDLVEVGGRRGYVGEAHRGVGSRSRTSCASAAKYGLEAGSV